MNDSSHPNAALLTRLFTALNRQDHEAMAACYHPEAHFRDIAFNLHGVEKIHDMWRMICDTDIRVEFKVLEADDSKGRVRLVDRYTFGAVKGQPGSGNPVVNRIDSHFEFEGGTIRHHHDYCDAKEWARQALDAKTRKDRIKQYLAGRIRLLRSLTARKKLRHFLREEGRPGRQ